MARAAPWGGLAVALSLLAAAASAAAATVHEAPVGGRLAAGGAGPATGGAAPAAATIRAYLGRVEPDVAGASLKVVRVTPSLSGVTHVVQEQLGPDGARIVGAYAKAALRDNGDLLRVAHTLAPTAEVAAAAAAAPAAAAAGGAGGEASAVAAALAYLGLAADTPWWKPPVAERVWLRVGANGAASDEGELAPGFEVRTWTAATNQLHYTYVAHGAVVGDRCATSGDSYRVYRYSPIRGGARVVKGPAKTGNGPSPDGWLSPGKMTTQDISGNNVHAYLDTNDDDEPDTDPALNATAVANGVFNAVATPSSGNPNTTNNRNAAVQNLFYQVNLAHDAAYRAGFVEAAGNFQDDNYGRFGAAGDAVDAQAQDGGGVNNANMATPDQDGEAPRMQMYLWNLDQGPYAEAEGKQYFGATAQFGPRLTVAGVTARARPIVALPVKGVDGSPGEGCTAAAPRSLVGVIAVVARGNCTFVTKVLNAQAAGAVGMLVTNYADTAHGITYRMVGFTLSPPTAGSFGEGASDTFAFLLNGDDRMARYAKTALVIGSAVNNGIRRYRYRGYPLTYRNLTGINTEVHNGGEIYAAAMWRLKELYDDAGLSTTGPSTNNVLLQDWIQGLAYIVRDPTLEDARDGLLAHLKFSHPERTCLAWAAFAQFGIGVGAKAVDALDARYDPNSADLANPIWVTTVAESFALPDECTGARGAAARAAPGPPPEPNAVTLDTLATRGATGTAGCHAVPGGCGGVSEVKMRPAVLAVLMLASAAVARAQMGGNVATITIEFDNRGSKVMDKNTNAKVIKALADNVFLTATPTQVEMAGGIGQSSLLNHRSTVVYTAVGATRNGKSVLANCQAAVKSGWFSGSTVEKALKKATDTWMPGDSVKAAADEMHGRPREFKHKLKEPAAAAAYAKKVAAIKQGTALVLECRRARRYDEAALKASEKLLRVVPEIYTVWNYRREALAPAFAAGGDGARRASDGELSLTAACLAENPKSYATWHHRKWVVGQGHADLQRELALVGSALAVDGRNFHAWAYRQFVAAALRLPAEEELGYAGSLIAADFSNYSAWHYRTLLLPRLHNDELRTVTFEELMASSSEQPRQPPPPPPPQQQQQQQQQQVPQPAGPGGFAGSASQVAPIPLHALDQEYDLVHQAFATDSADQSPWIYYRWLLGNSLAHAERAQADADAAAARERARAGAGDGASDGDGGGGLPLAQAQQRLEEARAVLGEVLAREVSRFAEHLALEPGAKWPLLMTARLKEAQARLRLGEAAGAARDALAAEARALYARLADLDPLRAGYYADAAAGKAFAERRLQALSVAAYGFSFLVFGVQVNLLGPTASALAARVGVVEADLGVIFTVNGAASIVGALPSGWLVDRLPGHAVLGAALAMEAAGFALVPAARGFGALAACFAAVSLSWNVVNTAGNTFVLWIGNASEHPRVQALLINSVNALFGVGALIAPLLAELCAERGAPLAAYWLAAGLTAAAAAAVLALPSPTPPGGGGGGGSGSGSGSGSGAAAAAAAAAAEAEALLRDGAGAGTADAGAADAGAGEGAAWYGGGALSVLLLVISAFNFLNVGTEVAFGGWIYTYAVEHVRSSSSTGHWVNAVYWASFTGGRVAASFAAARLSPAALLLTSLPIAVAGAGAALLAGAGMGPGLLAAVAALVGLGVAPGFANSLALLDAVQPCTGAITGLLGGVAGGGCMLVPLLVAQLAKHSPLGYQALMAVCTVSFAAQLALAVTAIACARRCRDLDACARDAPSVTREVLAQPLLLDGEA
ncbi:hypothetical protein HT031_006605 [Scenedesmus sp. PABB004]|nr:hypothetical protein HT031_006605 [Scenedesmus sp. PABB004]